MAGSEHEAYEDDDTSVAEARKQRQLGQPVSSRVESKASKRSGKVAVQSPPDRSGPSFLTGESKTDLAPPPEGVPPPEGEPSTSPYEARALMGMAPKGSEAGAAEPLASRPRKPSPHVVRSSERPGRMRAEHSTEMQFVDPLVDRLLGRKYRIKRHIASGGMGSVYEAEHVRLGHRVALKVLHTHLVKQTGTTKRFINEAKVAANLDHPNVVRAVDVDETDDGVPYFVLEYLDGQPLSAVLGRGRHLPVRRTLQIAMQILSALEAAHEKGIVHRDIKPENIFLLRRSGDQEHVKVLDFGIAKISSATRATSQGKIFGTPMYMSPEQLKDSSNVDERADIYAVGVLIYEMLGGTLPFLAEGLAELMIAALSTEPTPLDTLRTDLPDGLGALVRAAFAPEKEDRPPTVATLRHELSRYLTAATQQDLEHISLDPEAGTLDPEAVRNIQRWRRQRASAARRPAWQLAAAAVALLVTGLGLGFGLSFVASEPDAISIEPQRVDETLRVDPFAPAALADESGKTSEVSETDREPIVEVGEAKPTAEQALAADQSEEAEAEPDESTERQATRRTRRTTRSGARRSNRTRTRKKPAEPQKSTGLGFQARPD